MHKKYISQNAKNKKKFKEKRNMIFCYQQKPWADLNPGSPVHNPNTLTTEIFNNIIQSKRSIQTI